MVPCKSLMQVKPNVSILMTAYNTADYLAEAVESVLSQQTSCRWELLLVDDGSTDTTLAIARMYATEFPGLVQVFQHPHGRNCGISASRNLALKHATGSLIAFLDSDDVWLPAHLETLTAALHRAPEAVAVYGNAERWVEQWKPFDEAAARKAWWGENYLPPLVPPGEAAGLLSEGTLLRWFLEDESKVPCICSMLVRADAARAVNGFVNEFRGLYDDQAFHAKLSLRFPTLVQDTCVARYRQRAGSCCASRSREPEAAQVEHRRFLHFVDALQAGESSDPQA